MTMPANPTPPTRGRSTPPPKRFWQFESRSSSKASTVDVEHPPFEPRLPRVNLLPESVRESISVRKIRRAFIMGLLGLFVVLVGLWLMQNGTILEAEARLNAAQRENVTILNQVKALAPVGQLYQQITDQETFIREALASEAVASDVLTELQAVAGPSITYSNIAMTFTGVPNPAAASDPIGSLNLCPDADPFGTDITIGCVAFTAQGASRADVSDFLNRMAENPTFVGTYVTSTTVTTTVGGAAQLSFTGSTGISVEALKTVLTQEQIDALLQAAQPAPAPSGAAASPEAGG
jgi:hypothetical protein